MKLEEFIEIRKQKREKQKQLKDQNKQNQHTNQDQSNKQENQQDQQGNNQQNEQTNEPNQRSKEQVNQQHQQEQDQKKDKQESEPKPLSTKSSETKNQQQENQQSAEQKSQQSKVDAIDISSELEKTKSIIESSFGKSVDLTIMTLLINGQRALVCYLDSMTDDQMIAQKIIEPISTMNEKKRQIYNRDEFSHFCDGVFAGTPKTFVHNYQQAVKQMLAGFCVLFLEGLEDAVTLKIQNIPYRQISEPTAQTTIRGPKDVFTESADVNISLIRRRLKNEALRVESLSTGEEVETTVFLCYMDGIVDSTIVTELKQRIQRAKSNMIYDSGTLEEYIQDQTMTPFPLIFNSERPDSITAGILEGKIAIVVEESPFVLLVPAIFSDFFRVSEDYFQQFMMVSFIRFIRYGAFLLSMILPSIYVGIITFHQELIPTQLLISIISQREGIPFPTVVEAFIMELTFEVLREAGIRMPRAIGMTVSVVGGLVIGQAAVEAGLISSIMVIIVSLTAIAGFVSPVYSFSMAARLLRFGFIIIAASIGLYGVMLGLMVMVAHLNALRSFGVPYLASVATVNKEDQKDTFFRMPMWMMKWRPAFLTSEKPLKQPNSTGPHPPNEDDSS
ncbi:spore germination protein [Metabacillus iocasae]|uniref:Spore germination protein KA n=1 Tax=Priestia iocasae TaxID=2291674 RepID=A0ABS2QTU1_9BACI|nr:spore germination protein KA [Metabacillus iocasae]